MPVGDVSSFSQVDDALWGALEATSTTEGAALDAWRKEQNANGTSRGADFDSWEVPSREAVRATDYPALIVADLGALATGNTGADFEETAYPKQIVGLVAPNAKDKAAASAKAKKFALLVRDVLIKQRATRFSSFVSGTNPIKQVRLGEIQFPNQEQADLFVFTMSVVFVLDLPVR